MTEPINRYSALLILAIVFFSTQTVAQNYLFVNKVAKDSSLLDSTQTTTKVRPTVSMHPDSISVDSFKPNPRKNLWMGAIIPGYGQFLNRKYWKLPLVYGGILGFIYGISWNSSQYDSYKMAYRDITDSDPKTTSYIDILPPGRSIKDLGGITQYTSILKRKQDSFRRYRDLSIIAAIGFYAITLVDAYVDAQLYDFNISPDLSLKVQPTLLKTASGVPSTIGMQCSFNF